MSRTRNIALLLVGLLPLSLVGRQTAESLTLSTHEVVRYWHYQPEGGGDGPPPLLLFLHGGGESGDDLARVKKHGPPALIAAGQSFPAIVLSPQNPDPKGFWDEDRLARFLDAFIAGHEVDETRIYLTGLSRGAYGSWRLAMENPDRFAAMVVISGAAPAPYAGWLRDLPVRIFHGNEDVAIPVEESHRIFEALRDRGADVELTVYPGVGHDAWTRTYADPAVWDWLFKHRRSARP